ncbi:MAG: PilW family protein [Gammaproteobacteria bacterium]|nr:PilW family protein [Gammaproteobacteria bacterium]
MNNIDRGLPTSARLQRGLTLVEILVSLVISLFLVAGVIQLFIGTRQTYQGHDALSRIQENGRFALERMAWDIRMAGYVNPLTVPPPPAVPAIAGNDGASNNDTINVQWNNGAAVNQTYTIQCTGGAAPPCPNSVPASLTLNINDGAGAQQLIEGVDAMQILYGVCAGGVVNPPYVNAGAVANWNNVCSVQINLLLASLNDNLVTQPQTYFYQGAFTTATDRRFRQAFSTTVAIRNRILR